MFCGLAFGMNNRSTNKAGTVNSRPLVSFMLKRLHNAIPRTTLDDSEQYEWECCSQGL